MATAIIIAKMKSLRPYIRACRPTQWVKNSIVLAGLIFAVEFNDPTKIAKALVAFLAFCFLSSAVYLLNDIHDIESDREHPKKRNRPIASGQVPVPTATVMSIVLAIVALTASFIIAIKLGIVASVYLAMNYCYSYGLKRVVIVDVMTIAIGFVLRALAGVYAIDASISSWLLICTILLALFLGFSKRRHEVILLDSLASSHRKILDHYSLPFLDQMISVTTASTLVAYILYTMSADAQHFHQEQRFELTIPFVVYGIFRYLYIVYHKSEGGSPTESLLTDRPLLLNIGLWLVTVIILFLIP